MVAQNRCLTDLAGLFRPACCETQTHTCAILFNYAEEGGKKKGAARARRLTSSEAEERSSLGIVKVVSFFPVPGSLLSIALERGENGCSQVAELKILRYG